MKILLSATLIAASIASVHATPVQNTATTPSASPNPFWGSTTIDGETHTYDLSLPRDQRTIELKIIKKERKGETLITSANLSTLVASKRFNDHPKQFVVPIETTSTSQYLSDARDEEPKYTLDNPMTEGVFALVYVSDNTPILGGASVRFKVLDATKRNKLFDEKIDLDLHEGVNTKKMGPYTVTVTVGSVQPPSLAVFR